MRLNPRRGATLAELSVALVLAGVAAAIGGSVVLAAERHARRDAASDRESQVAREVAHVLATELASAHGDFVAAAGDTALDVAAHVGVSVACVVTETAVVLPATVTSLAAPYTTWRQPPEPRDWIAAWDSAAGGAWRTAVVDSVSSRADGAGCAADGAFRSAADSAARQPVTRLRLHAPLPPTLSRGAPVRVFRDVRWALYRAGDGAWWLGLRRCPAQRCGAAQPVTGPLAAPGDSGLVFHVGSGGILAISIRPPTRPGAPRARAITFTAAVRGARRAP